MGVESHQSTKIRKDRNIAYLATVNDYDVFDGAVPTVLWEILCLRMLVNYVC